MATFSIWLTPQEPEYSQFKDVISSLGKKYLTPPFAPHVTLLGAIEGSYNDVLKRYSQVIEENPNQIELDLLDMGSEELWYRALYVKAEKTPQLLDLFAKTLRIFEYDEQDYMPHLSLLYGALSLDIKSMIEQEIRNSYPKKIVIASVDLYETQVGLEYVKDWKKVQSIKLRANKS